MNKKILLTFVFVLAVALSVGTIYASDVNVTDSYASGSQDDVEVIASDDSSELQASESVVDNDSSNDVLKSEDSSTLSTNIEDSNALASDDNAQLESNISNTVTAKDVTTYYKGTAKYSATFLNIDGTPLVNKDIKFVLDGKSYTVKTNSKGVASLDITNLKPGTHKIVATNPESGYSLTKKIKVLSTIVSSDMSKVYTDSKKYTATFLNKKGKVLANKNIKFKINGRVYKVKTNSKGKASLSLTNLPKGTYKIISYNKDGLTKTNKVKVVTSAKTSLTTKTYTFLKSDTKKVKVKLLNEFGYAPKSGKVIKFKIDGKIYSANTNKNGVAIFKLPSLKVGIYNVKYKFNKFGYYKASSAKDKVVIIPTKNPTYTVKSTKTFGKDAGTQFQLALTSGSVPIANKKITLNVDGKKYVETTNSKGIVSLPINLDIGEYTIKYSTAATSKLNAKSGSTPISVVERAATSVNWKTGTTFYQGTQTCKILVLDANNKAVTSGNVLLNVNSKYYNAKVSSDGYATISASFTPGLYSVSYEYGGNNLNAPSSGTTALTVKKIDTISIANVIAGARTVKSYYASNENLPATVTAGGIKFTMPEFLYVMGEAITELGNSKTGNVPILTGVKAPASPSGDTINSVELYKKDYLTVAKNIVNYINTNKQAPNFANSAVGKIIYDELGDAFSRILVFYADNDKYLPNYCTITYGSGSSSSQGGTGLNQKNTVKDLTIYLKATANCQVGNSKLKTKVNSLIKNAATDLAKAKAIYNFVRDSISYSFYYDTHYGAVGTYNNGAGNCVDQAHLLVAMLRTAGLPARYVHGTCTFSSGSTYGHVWAQVCINNYWYVVDPTSSRNSFGTIVNWNTHSFSLSGTYASLPF
ncbi:transglutaminase domain-containing protein [Methanobrevibacter sp.]|uniref:transglutaminase domain-containing protein n=1 Tax=Methanobrevibacter sp. TaxID=66852 RepID=UPI00386D3D14